MTSEALDVFQMSVWRPTDLIEIRSFPPPHLKGSQLPQQEWLKASELPKMADRLKALNATVMNIYAGMLPRSKIGGGKTEHCLPGWVVWADFDHTTPEAALAIVVEVGLPEPTLVVNSGHGIQCHWGLTAATAPADICKLVGNIAEVTGSDPKVKDPPRVMRLPGFINHNLKPVAAPSSVYRSNVGVRYDFAALRALVPDCTEAIWKAENYIAVIPGVKEHEGRNNKAFQVAAKLRNDHKIPDAPAWRIFCSWNNRNTPPLDDREARAAFESGLSYAKQPPGNKLPATMTANSVPATPKKKLIELTATLTVPPSFLWGKRLPQNAIALLCGRPGIGKSFLTLDAAARVTTGAPFPGSTISP